MNILLPTAWDNSSIYLVVAFFLGFRFISTQMNPIQPVSKRKTYFDMTILCTAVVIGFWSLWHSGLWMEGRNKVPDFTFLSMVLLVFTQAIALKTGFNEKNKSNH
jgi:hypothetical protein